MSLTVTVIHYDRCNFDYYFIVAVIVTVNNHDHLKDGLWFLFVVLEFKAIMTI
jgi:hypothetical protein